MQKQWWYCAQASLMLSHGRNHNMPAIVHLTNNSQEEGNALADVLFGDFNPGGRLTQTWPRSMEQLPPMMDYNIRNGRTYMYFKGEPLYPFWLWVKLHNALHTVTSN